MAMSEIAQAGRARILQRIREALPEQREHVTQTNGKEAFAPILDPLARFQAECKANLTECVVVGNDLQPRLYALLGELPPGEIFVEDTAQFRQLLGTAGRPIRWSSEGSPREASQATLTRAHSLIAQTGSLLVSSGCGGRGASVVAPVHVVIAHERQIVPDLQTALDCASQQKLAEKHSFVGLITGCSRTGDIEKLLVIGAHGPKRLVVLLETSA
jgi:L-lactate dehydrogenase complex protein LldG